MKEKCFIIGSLEEYSWKVRMANMERRVNSKNFHGGCFEAVSPRTVLSGKESRLKRNFKLRRAMRGCSTVYVLSNYVQDSFACKLVELAFKWDKTVLMDV